MRRTLLLACVLAAPTPLLANELALQPPKLAARPCTPQQRNACGGGNERAIERDLACDACGPGALPMPADVVAPPASSRQPVECRRQLPLGPPAPGCTAPPLDNVPHL